MNAVRVPALSPIKTSSSEKFSGRRAFGTPLLDSSAHTNSSPACPPSFLIHCSVLAIPDSPGLNYRSILPRIPRMKPHNLTPAYPGFLSLESATDDPVSAGHAD